MEQKIPRLYTSAQLENRNDDLEQRLENNINHVISWNTSINNIKETNTYFNDKIHKPEKRYKIYKTLTSFLEPADTVVMIALTTISVTFLIFGFGMIVVPISAGIAVALSLSNKVKH